MDKAQKKLFKKVGIVVGAIFGLLLVAAIAIPLVVDVDKYRPQIVKAANDQINGKLELGKLSLSLWGQVRVDIAGLNLTDSKNHKLVSVQNAFFHVPLFPILTGSPVVTLKLMKPEVNVISDSSGKLNLMSLTKTGTTVLPPAPSATQGQAAAPSAAAPATKPTAAAAPSATSMALPAIATQARIGFEMRDATVVYKDVATKLESKIDQFNLVIKDLSLSRPMTLKMWADVNTKMGQSMVVRGPVSLEASAQPRFAGGNFEKVSAQLKIDLDKLEIEMPGLFVKKSGVAANAQGEFYANASEVRVEKLDVKFFNADMTATAAVTSVATTPQVKFALNSNPIQLKPWAELVPMLKDYELGGTLNLSASASGPSSKLNYGAVLGLKAITAKSAMLKTQPKIDGEIKVSTDMIEKMWLDIKAPANDLKITGKMVSFTKPQLSVDVNSTGMDLDQLINFPPPAKKGASLDLIHKAYAAEKPAADLDASMAGLRKNAMLAGMVAKIDLNIKSMKVYNVKLTNILSRMSFKDLTAGIDHLGFSIWSGIISANASANLKTAVPTYRFSASGSGVDLKQGMESQMEMLKNTVIGVADFKADVTGSSFNTEAAMKNLNGKGHLRVVNAKFTTIDVIKMAQGVNAQIEKVAQRVPQLRGKSLNNLDNKETRYESINTDFTISNGSFSAPNFFAKAETGKGLDIKGATTVGMLDYVLNARWELIDTHDVMGAKKISYDIGGARVDHALSEGNGPFRVPVNVGCTVLKPCYNYGEVPEFLAKVALNNTKAAAEGKLKAAAQQQIQQKIQQAAPPEVQKALDGLGKKLFGR
ncbi:AsmA family protein [bacterium]|nr:AsmA family protein [bacterium]